MVDESAYIGPMPGACAGGGGGEPQTYVQQSIDDGLESAYGLAYVSATAVDLTDGIGSNDLTKVGTLVASPRDYDQELGFFRASTSSSYLITPAMNLARDGDKGFELVLTVTDDGVSSEQGLVRIGDYNDASSMGWIATGGSGNEIELWTTNAGTKEVMLDLDPNLFETRVYVCVNYDFASAQFEWTIATRSQVLTGVVASANSVHASDKQISIGSRGAVLQGSTEARYRHFAFDTRKKIPQSHIDAMAALLGYVPPE